jgi:hypothetical protein
LHVKTLFKKKTRQRQVGRRNDDEEKGEWADGSRRNYTQHYLHSGTKTIEIIMGSGEVFFSWGAPLLLSPGSLNKRKTVLSKCVIHTSSYLLLQSKSKAASQNKLTTFDRKVKLCSEVILSLSLAVARILILFVLLRRRPHLHLPYLHFT